MTLCPPHRPGVPAPVQVEFKEAAGQFGQYQQEYDAERLRDQVFETVQVRQEWWVHACGALEMEACLGGSLPRRANPIAGG